MTLTVYAKGLTVEVFDNTAPLQPTISGFVCTPATVQSGQAAVLSATVQNALSVTLDGVPVTLPVTVHPTASHTYTLVAAGASGTTPANATASVVVNSGTGPLSTLAPGHVRDLGDYVNHGVTFGDNITDYCGMTIDVPNRRLIWGPAGGHGPAWDNGGYTYGIDSQTFGQLYPATPQAQHTAANADSVLGRWKSDNKPFERHTYLLSVVVNGALYILQGQGMPHPVGADPNDTSLWGGRPCRYTFADSQWQYSQFVVPWYQASQALWDAQMQRVVIAGTDNSASTWGFVWLYDPATDSTVKIYDSHSTQIFGAANALVFDPTTDTYYIINYYTGEVWSLKLDRATPTQSVVTKLTVIGKPNYFGMGSPYPSAYGYHAASKMIVGTVVAGKMNAFDPATRAWSSKQLLNEDGTNATMTQVFYMGVLDPTSDCYLFMSTPSAGAGGNPPGIAHLYAARFA